MKAVFTLLIERLRRRNKTVAREVAITSVLDEDPPFVGVGGAMQDTTCLEKIYWPQNLS